MSAAILSPRRRGAHREIISISTAAGFTGAAGPQADGRSNPGERFVEINSKHRSPGQPAEVLRQDEAPLVVRLQEHQADFNLDACSVRRLQRRLVLDLRDELVPHIQRRTNRDDLVVFGASFGAYHAANLAGRYPGVVRKAVLFLGLYDIHRFVDGYWDDLCYFHCPAAYIANMDADWVSRLFRVEWVIATGEYDSLVDDNRRFAALLNSKGIPNRTEIWPGVFGHDWPFWKDNLIRFLP